MKKLLSLFLLLFNLAVFAQGTAGTGAIAEYRYLVDMPSAGVLKKGLVGVSLDVMPEGVVITKIEVGVFNNFSFGISYGAANLIGVGEPGWYKLPGINARLRIVNETVGTPALTLGFDSQGKGKFNNNVDRYDYKSPGFFLAASKNFDFMGFLTLHGGINYSLERKDEDKDANIWFGLEKTIGSSLALMMEYNTAINDNSGIAFGKGHGYLNMGLRWSVGEGFTIGMDFRNMLDNNSKFTTAFADRAIFVEYIHTIF